MPVSADVERISDRAVRIEIREIFTANHLQLVVEAVGDKELRLSSEPADYLRAVRSLKPTSGNCFSGGQGHQAHSGHPENTEHHEHHDNLCIHDDELELALVWPELGGFARFGLTRMARHEIVREPPAIYAIPQLLERARTRNFNTRAEFEKVLQAKLTARNAHLNLLPHINTSTVLSLIPLSFTGFLRSIGDLLPFFLPNRWAQAAALKETSKAELDAFRVLQATTMNVVEGLALMVLRDEESIERMQENRLSIMAIRDEIITQEQAPGSIIQVGMSDEVNSVLNALLRSIYTLQEAVTEDRLALSQACGFFNPQAVADVARLTVLPVPGPLPGPAQAWEQLALNRSQQIAQLDHMLEAANHSATARLFQWIDPMGDSAGGIGFGLPSYIKIGQSQIRQIFDMRLNAESMLTQQIGVALVQSQLVFDNYRLAVEGSHLAELRITRLLLNFRTGNFGSGTSFVLADLTAALQDKVVNDVSQINGAYSYLALLAQMDFLTYSGPYAPLLGEHI